jgi:hypothetical protein
VLSPLLLPIAKQIGVDPIHFGVIVVMNLTIAASIRRSGSTSSCSRRCSRRPRMSFIRADPVRRAGDLGADAGDLYPALSLFLLPYMLG